MATNSVMIRNRSQMLIVIPEREEMPLGHPGGFVDFQARYPELCEGAVGGLGGMGSPAGGRSTSNAVGLGVASKLTLTSLSQPCLPVSNQGPTKILPFLYLGSQQDAMDQDTLSKYGIDYVLNMSVGCPKPEFVQDEHFMRIAVNDSHSEKLLPYFERAFEFLDKVKEANSCVLIHCLAGISRSPTLAIAFVMRHLHMSSEEAYRYVKEKRPAISPNFNFLGQLLEYEKQLKLSRQNELQQHGTHLGFNSVTPAPKPTIATHSVQAGSKTAATTPDYANAAKPLLFLNLQNTNCPAKVPVTQCSSSRDVATTIETSAMKRSSSCPVKIQRSGIGNAAGAGPLRDALNLEFEFSPATRTNANGKRQMMPSLNGIAATVSSNCREAEDAVSSEQPTLRLPSEETPDFRTFLEKFDKMQSEKLLACSDYFAARAPSPKNFGVKVLKPLHEELPSPSTELSKLNFDCGGGNISESMDVGEKKNQLLSFCSNVSSVSSPAPSWCPTTIVQIQSEFSSSSNKTATNFVSSFPKLPLTSTGFERRSSSGAAVLCSSASYSTCATNPFFSSTASIGGCDFQKTMSQFGVRMKLRSCADDSESSEPMTIVEETAEDYETEVKPCHQQEMFDVRCMVMEERTTEPTLLCYSPKDLTVSRSGGRGSSMGHVGNNVSAENPLFRTAVRGSFKQRKSRCGSVSSEKSEESFSEKVATCPLTAPVVLPSPGGQQQPSRMRSVRSESHLSSNLPTHHLTTIQRKLASARSMIVSSFSQRMRHLLTKRASWPHAVPYLAGISASESEASSLWALAPSGTKETPQPIISVDQGMEDFMKDHMAPSKSKSESTIFYGLYGQHIPVVIEDGGSVSSTSGTRINSNMETSLLAPPFDIDSPESGFVESPTTLLHQRDTTSSSTSSGHVAPQTASSMFLHHDPERDSLGSTSSLEIAVS